MVIQVLPHPPDELNLLLDGQAVDGRLQHGAQLDLVRGDEGVVVQVREEAHDELAVHAVRHAAVAGDGVAKVLDLEGALEARGEEAAKGGDERGKGGEVEGVQVEGRKGDGEAGLDGEERDLGHLVGVREEDGVYGAFEAGEDVGAEVLFFVCSC